MSIRFILGRAGTGKSTCCLETIIQEIQQDPLGDPLILLVPEQATHQMEMRLARTPELRGILRAQVLSFRRLGWLIFSETGGEPQAVLGEMGKRMLLRRVLLQCKPQLRIFARSATRPGMADLLAQMIREFKIYRITPDDLRGIPVGDSVLTQKLQELALLYDEFNQALGPQILDPDDELALIAEKIPASPSLRQAAVWIDGFKGFTPQELYAIAYLFKTAPAVTLTLPLDPEFIHRQASLTSDDDFFQPGEELFSEPWQTYQHLLRIARETGTQILPPILLEESHRFRNPELRYLEKSYAAYPTQPFVAVDTDTPELKLEGIQIFSAVNRQAEVHGIARELRRLAREEGLRWSNMAVMTRDLAPYEEIIEHIFGAYDLPYFLDRKRPILHHPLLELLMSSLEIIQKNWAYEPLFRALKTGFFPLSQNSLDRLENYCLAHGIQGDAWTSAQNWHYSAEEQEAQINQSRQTVVSILQPFAETVVSHAAPETAQPPAPQAPAPSVPPLAPASLPERSCPVNVRTVTEALYQLLLNLEVPATLERWSAEAREAGSLADARLQDQIWDAVIAVLDEMVTGLGEEVLELQDYRLILASGLEDLKLGLIPPGLDQIMVGSLDRSRNPESQVLFLCGANEGILPARPVSDGVLAGDEREELARLGLTLAPQGKAQLDEEQFFIYTGLTQATHRLVISYPLTDEEGKGLTVSPVVTRLRTLFPQLVETYLDSSENELETISHPQPLLPTYAGQLLKLRHHQPLSPVWQAVQTWYRQAPDFQHHVQLLEQGVGDENREENIPKRLARRLYGKRLMVSVSRLEKFARCPFAHYAKYGLKLQERPLYQLTSPDMGQFFHAVLRDFAEKIREEHLDWGNMSKEDSWTIINELAEAIAPQLQNEILLSNARYRYLKNKLKRTVHHAVRVLGEHARQGIFVPIRLEVPFGPGQRLPALEFPLQDGNSLLLRGQIDRIDTALLDEQVYIRIMDYKSRQAHVDLNHIYYGLDLQLLAYLDAALQGAEVLMEPSAAMPPRPAGILYFPVVEPQLESKTLLSPEELETKRINAVKVKGFLLADRQVLEAMDQTLQSGQSDLLGIKLTKNLEFRKNANVLTDDQFSLLREHLHWYLRKTGEEILSGQIAISPYRQGQENACRYCEFKPVCHFDPFFPENHYRDLPVLKDPEVWNQIAREPGPAPSSPPLTMEGFWLGDDEHMKEGEQHE